jgi:hypothetical protein
MKRFLHRCLAPRRKNLQGLVETGPTASCLGCCWRWDNNAISWRAIWYGRGYCKATVGTASDRWSESGKENNSHWITGTAAVQPFVTTFRHVLWGILIELRRTACEFAERKRANHNVRHWTKLQEKTGHKVSWDEIENCVLAYLNLLQSSGSWPSIKYRPLGFITTQWPFLRCVNLNLIIVSRVGVTYNTGSGLGDRIYCTLCIHTTRD